MDPIKKYAFTLRVSTNNLGNHVDFTDHFYLKNKKNLNSKIT